MLPLQEWLSDIGVSEKSHEFCLEFTPVIIFYNVDWLPSFLSSTLWAFLSGGSIHSAADRSHLIQYILKEYITFPIILSNKNFTEMENGACCILFKGFKSPVVYHEKDMDLRVLNKAVEDLLVQDDGSSRSRTNLKSTWTKQPEIIKESYGDSLRNLLFYLPGCISADECGNRLFLSDSNHHWIIVVDGNGFEDGNFECAKLARPAASFYDAAEDCLYFVDSEFACGVPIY
ncbi:hypothetical protein ACFX2F_035537 [Malus domestica]